MDRQFQERLRLLLPHKNGARLDVLPPPSGERRQTVARCRAADRTLSAESWEGVIAECRFERGRCREARLVPLTLNEVGLGGPDDMATRGLPMLASADRATAILDRIAVRSRGFGVQIDRRSGRVTPRAS